MWPEHQGRKDISSSNQLPQNTKTEIRVTGIDVIKQNDQDFILCYLHYIYDSGIIANNFLWSVGHVVGN